MSCDIKYIGMDVHKEVDRSLKCPGLPSLFATPDPSAGK